MFFTFYIFSILCINKMGMVEVDDNIMISNIKDDLDPNDMLSFYSTGQVKTKLDESKDDNIHLEDGCSLHKEKIRSMNKLNNICNLNLATTTANLKEKYEVIKTLQYNNTNNGNPAVATFYHRMLKSFWQLLEMEQIEKVLMDEDEKIEVVRVSFSLDDINSFRSFFNENKKHSELDEFFRSKFEKITPTDEKLDFEMNWINSLKSLEVWLCGLFVLVFILSCWAFSLCIIDAQKNMRWTRVVGIIFFLLFVISCIEQWRIMVKNVEAKKRTQESQFHPNDCALTQSYWEIIRISVLGGESMCEKYHRQILLQSSEEVTPLMAITETISLFFLHPLQNFGTYFGRFFNNFYENVPLIWAIPATITMGMFTVLILFVTFGYGLDFPFWLGGIRPISHSGTNEKQFNKIIEENRKQLRDERNSLLTEAKEMFRDISIAAISHTQRVQTETCTLQPLFTSSASIIEKQLELLITKRFTAQLERSSNGKSNDAVDSSGRLQNAIVIADKCSDSQDDFVTQIKNILEDSDISSPCSPNMSECSISDCSPNKFLAEVKDVMTP